MIVPPEFHGAVVLVVDDNETTRYVFGRWLRRAGFEVLEAATGEEAFTLLTGRMPDVAILDVHLPDMSGFDVLARVKDLDASVPALHVSATAIEVGDRSEGLQRGADAYLIEPVDREELLATVVALLRYSTARRAAERLSAQMTSLHDGLVDMHAASSVEDLIAVAARAAARILDRTLSVLAYAGGHGAIAAADPRQLGERGAYRAGELRDAIGPGAEATGGAVLTFTVDAFQPPARLEGVLAPLSGRSVEGVYTRHNRGDGVACVLVSGRLDERDLVIASQIVRSVAVAVDNLRLYEVERGMALTLQRALLPDQSPSIPGLAIATRYVASDEHSEVGGDFFDAFLIDHDRVALVIGDVQGHSLHAASVMGDLRAAVRAYLVEGLGPAEVVLRTNRLFMRFVPWTTATMCLAVLDLTTRRLVVVNAGHLPPLVAAGSAAWWLVGGGALLGVDLTDPIETDFTIPAGAAVVFVTDGLVERRRQSLDVGLAVMAEAVRDVAGDDPDVICQVLLDRCRPDRRVDVDDIAVMVVRLGGDAEAMEGHPPTVTDGGRMGVERIY